MSVLTFSVDGLVADARRKEGLEDLGEAEEVWRDPLAVVAASYDAADLSDAGRWILPAGLVHSLRQRLRTRLFVERAAALGDDLSRETLIESMGAVDGWTSNGLHSPQRVSEKRIGDC